MARRRKDAWPDEHDAAMRQCLADGMTLKETAKHLTERFGRRYTRSAIGGRCNRVRVKSINPPACRVGVKQEWTPAREQASQARRKPAPAPIHQRVLAMPQFNRDGLSGLRCAEVEPKHLTILEVAECDGCRWPFGIGPYTFCGLTKLETEPYCLDHFALSIRRAA